MNYFDLNKFVEKEILPEINAFIEDYLEDTYSYIENKEDLEDLEYAEVTDELLEEVRKDIYRLIDDCKNEYDFSSVDDKELNNELLFQIVDSAFTDYKDILIERYNDTFEREEYIDEYYSNTEF